MGKSIPGLNDRYRAACLMAGGSLPTISLLSRKGIAMTLTVVKAAIRTEDGDVFSVERPGRHHDVIRLMRDSGYDGTINGDMQGFVLSDGRFVMRKAAMTAAVKSGQVTRDKCVAPGIGLFSEDLW